MSKGYTNMLKREHANLMAVARAVQRACDEQRSPQNDAELDDEQPISLNVQLTLGDVRKMRRVL